MVTTQILTTKLFAPFPRPNMVSRPRLLNALQLGSDSKLTLISAPAGYGKSTLLSEWVHQNEIPVGWLSLDSGDNDPVRFWDYFVAALQTIQILEKYKVGENLLRFLLGSPVPDHRSFIEGLISDVAAIPEQFFLVLDDFHTITEPQIRDGLFHLLETLPLGFSGFHLIISSRSDPPWPLARLRVRGELSEVRSKDLRFSREEAALFLNEVMGLALSPENVGRLESRTEGWIAGLQMAAISMRDRDDRLGFIQAFTGSHRYVMDYLMEEVLEQQSPEITHFLLKTSVLERMNSELCDAVINEPSTMINGQKIDHRSLVVGNSQSILESLEQNNLFLIPLDDLRNWYRYHHLFADLLQHRLRQDSLERFHHLHHKAASWFLKQGQIPEAINHAFAANDLEMAAEIIEENTLTFFGDNALVSVIKFLDNFPKEMIESRPWLSLTKAWALAYLGDSSSARELLERAEHGINQGESANETKRILGHIAAIKCYLSLLDAEYALSAEYGYTALENLDVMDYQTRLLTASTMGAALRWDGKLAEARGILGEMIELADKHSDNYTIVRLLCTLALIDMNQAKFQEAIRTLEKAVQISQVQDKMGEKKVLPFVGQVFIRLGDVYTWMNRPNLALENLIKGIELAEKWGQVSTLWDGYRCLTLLLQTKGDLNGSREAWDQALRYAKRMSSKMTDEEAETLQAAIWLKEGNLKAVENWLDEKNIQVNIEKMHFSQIEEYELLVEVLLAREKAEDALMVLAKTLDIAEEAGAASKVITEQLFCSLAHQQLGQETEAFQALSHAVALGEDSGMTSVFIRLCKPLSGILRQILTRGVAVHFITEILAGIEKEEGSIYQTSNLPAHHLVDSLSEREVEILRLLITELSVPEISNELVVSVSTVRSHIKHIYSKLDVHSRYEAVARAKELGIL